jgi:hypothetical protein
MAGCDRSLLSQGTDKMGATIFGWSIPAISTCPGKTSICRKCCYATHGRYVTDKVKRLMRWRLLQSRQEDWVGRMSDELFRRGVLVCRIHVSGDFYSPEYTSKWIDICARSQHTRFFAYTRSWRVPTIEPYLRALAALKNVRLWYSADTEAAPTDVPPGVRVAWLQVSEQEEVAGDLVFQVRRLRGLELPLAVPVCPQEKPEGKAQGVNCANCGLCWE